MPEQNNWKEEFEKMANTCGLRERTLIEEFNERKFIKDFIEKTLSSQAHALKEQMKKCVPDPMDYIENTLYFKVHSKQQELYNQRKDGFNACRSEALSAIESIEI